MSKWSIRRYATIFLQYIYIYIFTHTKWIYDRIYTEQEIAELEVWSWLAYKFCHAIMQRQP